MQLSRLIAIMMLIIPGFAATWGFLAMKNAIFESFGPPTFPWPKFILGFIAFILGVAFIAGWIFFRDRKRNYVHPRFKKKRPLPPRSPQQ